MSKDPLSQRLARVRQAFDAQSFMGYLNATISNLEEGICEISLPHHPQLTQQHGLFHGGVVATLADNSAGFAACSLMDLSTEPLSVEFKVNFINKAVGEQLVARAEVVKNGKTLKVCRVEVFGLQNEKSSLCAVAIATIMAVKPF